MSPVRSLERRQITVLFCDVVGWSSLAQQVDPEELADLIRAYRRRCATIVARARGDGLPNTSATGWSPILATLTPTRTPPNGRYALRSISSKRTTDRRRSSRYASESPRAASSSGTARGTVAGETGELPNSTPRSPPSARRPIWRLVFSRSPRQAPSSCRSRHSACAAACSSTRISDVTSSKGSLSRCRRGRVLRESGAQSRFHALRAANLTPLVNRRAELEEIARLWESAKAGNGSTLLVSGEPGIGKSRLADEVTSRLVDDGRAAPSLLVFFVPQEQSAGAGDSTAASGGRLFG